MSDVGGHVALTLFFASLTIIGGGVLAYILHRLTIQEWRANHEFVESRCRVIDERIAEIEQQGHVKYRPEFVIRYTVDGQELEVAAFDAARAFFTDAEDSRRVLQEFDVGREYPCWYDPHDTSTVVLRRGYSWYAWLVPLLPAAFVAVGFGGLVYTFLTWGKSQEHRSLLQQGSLDPFDPQRSIASRYPTVPDDLDFRNSPGTSLPYRLPSVPVIGSVLVTTLALVWNAATAWFAVDTLRGFSRGGSVEWPYLPVLGAFVVAGGYLLYLAGRKTLTSWGIEPTIVEISEHPFYPGGDYTLYVAQTGRLQVNSISVSLACDEEATFQQGTNSRTHRHRVVETELYRSERFRIEPRNPFAVRIPLVLPNDVMHSFQSVHNAVKWKVVVRADLLKWPNFEREFTVVVCPGSDGGPPA